MAGALAAWWCFRGGAVLPRGSKRRYTTLGAEPHLPSTTSSNVPSTRTELTSKKPSTVVSSRPKVRADSPSWPAAKIFCEKQPNAAAQKAKARGVEREARGSKDGSSSDGAAEGGATGAERGRGEGGARARQEAEGGGGGGGAKQLVEGRGPTGYIRTGHVHVDVEGRTLQLIPKPVRRSLYVPPAGTAVQCADLDNQLANPEVSHRMD
ncbi:MAG: hypothetical protein BJ554DRAFT_7179, partial [Olpidium bornovanus]